MNVGINLCVTAPDGTDVGCMQRNDNLAVDDDGTFAVEFELTDLGQIGEYSATTVACANSAPCPPAMSIPACDNVQSSCSIRVDVYAEGYLLQPTFPPAPVPISFRST